jgi:hypothetical protein
MIGFINTINYSVIANLPTLQITSSQYSLVVYWQRIYNSLTVTTTHIKSSFRRLIPLYSCVLLQFSFYLTLSVHLEFRVMLV